MTSTISYLLEFSLCYFCFYLLYFSLLKGKSEYKFQRFYIISTSILSAVIPFLPNGFGQAQNPIGIVLAPITIGAANANEIIEASNATFPLSKIIIIVYLVFMLGFLFRFIIGFVQIIRLSILGEHKSESGMKLVFHEDIKTPFSFFTKIFLPSKYKDQANLNLVLEHEMQHIKQGHTLEKLILLINRIVFWWHPVSHLFIKEIELVHEYEVDEIVAGSSSKKNYSLFLLSQFEQKVQFQFVNNISSNIKKRIVMLSNQKTSIPTIVKWGSYLSLLVFILVLHSCQEEDPGSNLETLKAESKISESDLEGTFSETVIDTMFTFDFDTNKEKVELVSYEETVYKNPEIMPLYGDCIGLNDTEDRQNCSDKNLLMFIYKNLIYPKEAKSQGIEGMAVAQFTIGSNGNVRNPKILRSLGGGTDEAILSVFDKMKSNDIKWTPGKQKGKEVSVLYTLPVKFKLEG